MKKQLEIDYAFGYVYDKSKLIVMYPAGTNVIDLDDYEMEVEVAFLEDGIDAAFEENDVKEANETIKPLETFLMKPSKVIPFVTSIKNAETKEELHKLLAEFDEEYEVKENYIKKGYEIKDIYHVFENVVSYIPKENLENLNILKIENIEKYYGSKSSLTKAIDNISFEVEKGEFVAIMGSSGSGKTTLLNCISTIDKVTAGHIFVGGTDITKLKGNDLNKFRREDLGFIFQDFNLLDTLTAYENIALALSIQNVGPKEIDKRIKKVAKELDIESVLKKYPYQMSGGQKQRVAAARAIITNPKLILADEPTGALDSKSSKMLLEKLTYLNNALGATILMVTHDAYAASYATRIIFIKDGKI